MFLLGTDHITLCEHTKGMITLDIALPLGLAIPSF